MKASRCRLPSHHGMCGDGPNYPAETSVSTTSLNISLPDSLREFALKRVEEGEFGDPSGYVRALISADRERQGRLEVLRSELEIGIEQLDRDEGILAEEVFDRIRARSSGRS